MKRILLVCTGNICRTPMATALMQRELQRAGVADQVVAESAGTYALEDTIASRGSRVAMETRGLDISAHRGRQLDAALVQAVDIILVMEEEHRRSIFYSWPQALRKTFLLSEMAGAHAGIDDPYGMSQAAYDQAAAIIEEYVRRGLPNILQRLHITAPKH